MKLHPLGVGEMIRALGTLKPEDENTRQAIVGMLGFELRADEVDEPDDAAAVRRRHSSAKPIPPRPDTPDAATPQERDFRLLPQAAQARSAAAQPLKLVPADPLPQGAPENSLPRPPFEPLLQPLLVRAIVSTMLRISRRTGPPLIPDLVEAVLRMKPLFNLPASLQQSVSGVDVLLDIGENMVVFGRDQEWLLSLIRRVVGEDQVTVFSFSGSPERGVTSEGELAVHIYAPPRPGWPVLLLTDLGIGARHSGYDPVSAAEWQGFADRMRVARCPLIALVPYSRARWPKIMPGIIDIIQWDRLTNVGSIRSAIGRPDEA